MYNEYQKKVQEEWRILAGKLRTAFKSNGMTFEEIDQEIRTTNFSIITAITGKDFDKLMELSRKKHPDFDKPTMTGALNKRECERIIRRYRNYVIPKKDNIQRTIECFRRFENKRNEIDEIEKLIDKYEDGLLNSLIKDEKTVDKLRLIKMMKKNIELIRSI